MTVFCVGVDPGVTTGVGILNATGVVDFWQDDMRPSVRRLIMWIRENRDAVGGVGIEDAFLGKGAHASLSVARAGGFVDGALYVAGYPSDRVITLHPSTWRSDVGVKGRKRPDKEAAARVLAAGMTGYGFTTQETHAAEALCMAQAVWNKVARQTKSPVWRNSRG